MEGSSFEHKGIGGAGTALDGYPDEPAPTLPAPRQPVQYKRITKEQQAQALEGKIADLEMRHRQMSIDLEAARSVAESTPEGTGQRDTSTQEAVNLDENLSNLEVALAALHSLYNRETRRAAGRRG